MAGSLFGWELLYNSVASDIRNNQDILVCLTHLVLVSNEFKCIGLGESKNMDGSEPKTESLPKFWNDDYALRYVYQGRLYNLKGTSLEDGIIINLVRVDERTVGMIQLNVRQVVKRTGSLDEMIPDNKRIVEQIKKELIDVVIVSTKSKSAASQTEPSSLNSQSTEPYREPPPSVPLGLPSFQPPINPYDYGRADLDPFGVDPLRIGPRLGPGGGMLFQPPRGLGGPGNLGIPPGSLPPGARFDPFRPPDSFPNPRVPRRPDNDDFPPPGYDDMFM